MKTFPKWFRVIGWVIYPITLSLVARFVYEKTYLTWSQGPQNIGFSLVHLYPIYFFAGVIASFLSQLWLALALGLLLWSRARIAKADWIQFVVIGLTVAVDYIPIATWQGMMKTLFGSGK